MNRERMLNRLRGCCVTVPTQFHAADVRNGFRKAARRMLDECGTPNVVPG